MPDGTLLVTSHPINANSTGLAQLLYAAPENQDLELSIVSIDALKPADSPRLAGLDSGHAQALAEVETELPPILVQRSTMRVIDGMHRLNAARLRGQQTIAVRYFAGSEEDSYLLGVAANIKHGLPLTLADRRAAAARIIQLRPAASDRSIAEVAGITAKTVAAIRRQVPGSPLHLARRIGRDGRLRPLSAAEGRRAASKLFEDNPELSLRHVAREAGISVGTARDVRNKIEQGLDPVQPKRPANTAPATPLTTDRLADPVEYADVLQRLQRDPSLRYTQSGRALLRWLSAQWLIANSDWADIISFIPPHCAFDVVRIAKGCSLVWAEFAEEVDRRNRSCGFGS